jgi:transcriptional regulator with AAA-type ATPase domain
MTLGTGGHTERMVRQSGSASPDNSRNALFRGEPGSAPRLFAQTIHGQHVQLTALLFECIKEN